mgnify:CR=1 FL=1
MGIGQTWAAASVWTDADSPFGQYWAILKEFYESAYFLGSRAPQATEVVPIALEHINSERTVHE